MYEVEQLCHDWAYHISKREKKSSYGISILANMYTAYSDRRPSPTHPRAVKSSPGQIFYHCTLSRRFSPSPSPYTFRYILTAIPNTIGF
ncbi:hypothetical protein M378DRAFT_169520, partial [Amanita muscaria Koide BX008]